MSKKAYVLASAKAMGIKVRPTAAQYQQALRLAGQFLNQNRGGDFNGGDDGLISDFTNELRGILGTPLPVPIIRPVQYLESIGADSSALPYLKQIILGLKRDYLRSQGKSPRLMRPL